MLPLPVVEFLVWDLVRARRTPMLRRRKRPRGGVPSRINDVGTISVQGSAQYRNAQRVNLPR
jgi:hypothetical protein